MRFFIALVVFGMIGFSTGAVRAESNVSGNGQIEPLEVQKALKEAGFYQGALDGIIGPKTRQAIRTFQAEHGLSVDGVCGPQTWGKLKVYLNEGTEGETEEEEISPTSIEDSSTLVSTSEITQTEASPESANLKQKLVS